MKKTFVYFVFIEQNNSNNRKCFTAVHNLFLLHMSLFYDLVIKDGSVKRAKSFFLFMEGVQLYHNQVLVLEDRTFHYQVLSRQQI